jgi:hypothetical protein
MQYAFKAAHTEEFSGILCVALWRTRVEESEGTQEVQERACGWQPIIYPIRPDGARDSVGLLD